MHLTIEDNPVRNAAATHLDAAAQHADALAGGDLFSPWAALAGQIHLFSGALSPTADRAAITAAAGPGAVLEHIDAALAALANATPAQRPTDAALWYWWLSDLRREAATLTQAQGQGQGQGQDR